MIAHQSKRSWPVPCRRRRCLLYRCYATSFSNPQSQPQPLLPHATSFAVAFFSTCDDPSSTAVDSPLPSATVASPVAASIESQQSGCVRCNLLCRELPLLLCLPAVVLVASRLTLPVSAVSTPSMPSALAPLLNRCDILRHALQELNSWTSLEAMELAHPTSTGRGYGSWLITSSSILAVAAVSRSANNPLL
ncbi:hypothetical protein B296_00006132 [Ensete ventricosum]|uniref:Uncharacterized protein n=1 Tax=Ensete ventricosum TaxID=4639 RepID=A0A427ABT1_ENSVE|nr:hypothetical protein B296_00006132 [Ensete ventricosum]